MTRAIAPRTCDGCAEKIDVKADLSYTFELQKTGTKKGQFIKSGKGDFCTPCFKKLTGNGWDPNWTIMEKDPVTGKWGVVDNG